MFWLKSVTSFTQKNTMKPDMLASILVGIKLLFLARNQQNIKSLPVISKTRQDNNHSPTNDRINQEQNQHLLYQEPRAWVPCNQF